MGGHGLPDAYDRESQSRLGSSMSFASLCWILNRREPLDVGCFLAPCCSMAVLFVHSRSSLAALGHTIKYVDPDIDRLMQPRKHVCSAFLFRLLTSCTPLSFPVIGICQDCLACFTCLPYQCYVWSRLASLLSHFCRCRC